MHGSLARLSNQTRTKRRVAWAVLFLSTLTVIAIVFTPVFLIMPFKPQTARSLEISYLMRRWSPSLTLLASIVSVTLLLWLWRGTRWWWRGLLTIVLAITFALTWLSRQNHFEWMFNPLPNATYATASDAGFISNDDRVMAIELAGEAVAYPIKLMAYHHVVSDTVGGIPVIATY